MGDLIEGIEWLNMPSAIGIIIITLMIITQILGEVIEIFGKTAPGILKIRKIYQQKKKEKQEIAETLKQVKILLRDVNNHYSEDNITKRNGWIDSVDKSISSNDKIIKSLEKKIDQIIKSNETLTKGLKELKEKVLENEADRLRSELFECGNRCRRNIRLHPEEMDHIRDVFHKYSNVLKQNGPGEAEFNFITQYYNQQKFPDYHQKNSQE